MRASVVAARGLSSCGARVAVVLMELIAGTGERGKCLFHFGSDRAWRECVL